MTPKQRMHAALEGRPADHLPVTVAYNQLYHEDHFAELTGREGWEFHKWRYAPVEEHLTLYRRLIAQAPFDILQPQMAPSREERDAAEFVLREGVPHLHDRRRDVWQPLAMHAGHPRTDKPNETQHVRDRQEARRRIKPTPAERQLETGWFDHIQAAVRELGDEHFIMGGGVIGSFYSCSWHVGLTNLLGLAAEQPEFVDYLCRLTQDCNIERVRALAACGGDAVYIDDAMTTCDVISPAMYERFSLPYMTELVAEAHRLRQKVVLIYFGGVADRLEMIASTGADGLLVECSMKNYVNDIADFAARVGGQITLFGNVDPVNVLEKASENALAAEVARQAAAGRIGRGMVMSTGSPITPDTPLRRVQRFIELAHASSTAAP